MHHSSPDLGRRLGSGPCPLGGGRLAGDGDAHCGSCGGSSLDSGNVCYAPGSLDVIRGRGLAPPAGLAVGSPAQCETLLYQTSSPASVASSGLPPPPPRLRSPPTVSPPSGLAALNQDMSWSDSLPLGVSADPPLLPAPLTLRRMVEGMVVPEPVVSSPAGDTDLAGGSQQMPDLSLEGPFDVHQVRTTSGASPRVLDGMRGCQYRMTSYDQESGGPDFNPAYGIQLHNPRLLEYVGATESA